MPDSWIIQAACLLQGSAERGGEAGPAQPEEEEEGRVQDAPEEEGLSEDASEEKDEVLPHEEAAAASSEAEEPQREVTLEVISPLNTIT